MSITKDYRYKVGVAWEGDRMTSVSSPGKPELEVATPPEFKGGVPERLEPGGLARRFGRIVLRRHAGCRRREARPAAPRSTRERHGASDAPRTTVTSDLSQSS